MKLESAFKKDFVNRIEEIHPEAIIINVDPTNFRSFPDTIVLLGDRWAAFEIKRYARASKRPNQNFYIDLLENISFARFVYPENMEEVLDELEDAFGSE